MVEAEETNLRFKLQRNAGGITAFFRKMWHRWWFKLLAVSTGAAVVLLLFIWFVFARNLPDASALLEYEPPLPTIVRSVDGEPVQSYARERRVQLQYADYPPLLIRAYMAAEDRTFFQHHGLDYPGIISAMFTNMTRSGRPVGASTITQQVAKNLLLTNEVSYVRKAKEAILAYRIESVMTKQQILELYLNQIFLGRNAYGVQAAARAYFDKDVGNLKLHEMAYLAILPKGPSNYRPEVHMDRAIERRNWVLNEMRKNDWIDRAQYEEAIAQPLGTVAQQSAARFERAGGYYIEEVRRRLIEKFGETDKDGPHSVYAGGLWVRTPLDTTMQELTRKALRDGLVSYDRGKGWSGPVNRIEMDDKWARRFASTFIGIDYADWKIAVVVSKSGRNATIGFPNGSTGTLPEGAASMPYRKTGGPAFDALRPGDLIAVSPQGSGWQLRNIPGVSGGMVVENPHNGRIYAMQGGFDSRLSSFNRATQAERQPGSTIKPFVYAAALDHGMTPASIIVDGPFCVFQSVRLGQKCFRNFSGRGAGPQTMRWGVEQSRNLMTVRTASQTGMDKVVKTIKTMGIGDYTPYLSFALGAGETTVERLVNAYAMLANHGRELTPKVIDFVQDRRGKVIWPENWRPCDGCNKADWDGKPMPRFRPSGRQLLDPMTAYQVVHITQGVITRGTAQRLRDMDRPLFGKTGTTNGPTNVWFIGGSPDLVAGVYLGYDQPRDLGGWVQGGNTAAPIWRQAMEPVLNKLPKRPFIAPAGMRMVRIDRRSGRRVYGEWPTSDPKAAVIWEAFKPETEPRRTIRREEIAQQNEAAGGRGGGAARKQNDNDFLQREGGIY
jgi:penicillin-binding protein 1A